MSSRSPNAVPDAKAVTADRETDLVKPNIDLVNREIDLLHGILSQLYTTFIDFELKMGAILIAALAWIITAKPAQDLLSDSLKARSGISAGAAALTILHGVWVYRFYRKSRRVNDHLKAIKGLPGWGAYFDYQTIDVRLALTFAAVHVAGIATFLWIAWNLP